MENTPSLSFYLKEKTISLIFNLLFFDDDKEPEFKLIDGKLLAQISDNFRRHLFENEVIETYNHFSTLYSKKLDSKQKNNLHSLYLYICNTSFDKNIYLKSIGDLTTAELMSLQVADSFLKNKIEHPLAKGFIADLVMIEGGIQIYKNKYISKDFYKNVIIKQVEKYDKNVKISRRI